MTKKPDFKKDQIWRTRDGRLVQIVSIDHAGRWPIVANPYSAQNKKRDLFLDFTFTKDGYFHSPAAQRGADLVELVEPKAKEFAVGQVWKQANGDHVKITSVTNTSITFPISAWYCDETGENLRGAEEAYTLDGKYFAGRESECDLVGLVKTVEPAHAPSPQFKVGQVWESRDGEKFTITDIDDHQVYPIEAVNKSSRRLFTSSGGYRSSRPSGRDLVKLISEPESEPIASPPELQAIFNGEKPVYVVVADDGGVDPGEPIVMETSILPSNSFASFREALERQESLSNFYGTTYIAECRIIPATRFDK